MLSFKEFNKKLLESESDIVLKIPRIFVKTFPYTKNQSALGYGIECCYFETTYALREGLFLIYEFLNKTHYCNPVDRPCRIGDTDICRLVVSVADISDLFMLLTHTYFNIDFDSIEQVDYSDVSDTDYAYLRQYAKFFHEDIDVWVLNTFKLQLHMYVRELLLLLCHGNDAESPYNIQKIDNFRMHIPTPEDLNLVDPLIGYLDRAPLFLEHCAVVNGSYIINIYSDVVNAIDFYNKNLYLAGLKTLEALFFGYTDGHVKEDLDRGLLQQV